MTPTQKLERDLDMLRDTIKRDWPDIGSLALSDAERGSIKTHIQGCAAELFELIKRLEKTDAKGPMARVFPDCPVWDSGHAPGVSTFSCDRPRHHQPSESRPDRAG